MKKITPPRLQTSFCTSTNTVSLFGESKKNLTPASGRKQFFSLCLSETKTKKYGYGSIDDFVSECSKFAEHITFLKTQYTRQSCVRVYVFFFVVFAVKMIVLLTESN